MSNEKPQFGLTCIKSEFSSHLIPGLKYKVDPFDVSFNDITKKKEVAVYWANPLSPPTQIEWNIIGYFPLDNFNADPIKKWVRIRKGLPPEKETISRVRPPIAVSNIVRKRPEVIKQRPRRRK